MMARPSSLGLSQSSKNSRRDKGGNNNRDGNSTRNDTKKNNSQQGNVRFADNNQHQQQNNQHNNINNNQQQQQNQFSHQNIFGNQGLINNDNLSQDYDVPIEGSINANEDDMNYFSQVTLSQLSDGPSVRSMKSRGTGGGGRGNRGVSQFGVGKSRGGCTDYQQRERAGNNSKKQSRGVSGIGIGGNKGNSNIRSMQQQNQGGRILSSQRNNGTNNNGKGGLNPSSSHRNQHQQQQQLSQSRGGNKQNRGYPRSSQKYQNSNGEEEEDDDNGSLKSQILLSQSQQRPTSTNNNLGRPGSNSSRPGSNNSNGSGIGRKQQHQSSSLSQSRMKNNTSNRPNSSSSRGGGRYNDDDESTLQSQPLLSPSQKPQGMRSGAQQQQRGHVGGGGNGRQHQQHRQQQPPSQFRTPCRLTNLPNRRNQPSATTNNNNNTMSSRRRPTINNTAVRTASKISGTLASLPTPSKAFRSMTNLAVKTTVGLAGLAGTPFRNKGRSRLMGSTLGNTLAASSTSRPSVLGSTSSMFASSALGSRRLQSTIPPASSRRMGLSQTSNRVHQQQQQQQYQQQQQHANAATSHPATKNSKQSSKPASNNEPVVEPKEKEKEQESAVDKSADKHAEDAIMEESTKPTHQQDESSKMSSKSKDESLMLALVTKDAHKQPQEDDDNLSKSSDKTLDLTAIARAEEINAAACKTEEIIAATRELKYQNELYEKKKQDYLEMSERMKEECKEQYAKVEALRSSTEIRFGGLQKSMDIFSTKIASSSHDHEHTLRTLVIKSMNDLRQESNRSMDSITNHVRDMKAQLPLDIKALVDMEVKQRLLEMMPGIMATAKSDFQQWAEEMKSSNGTVAKDDTSSLTGSLGKENAEPELPPSSNGDLASSSSNPTSSSRNNSPRRENREARNNTPLPRGSSMSTSTTPFSSRSTPLQNNYAKNRPAARSSTAVRSQHDNALELDQDNGNPSSSIDKPTQLTTLSQSTTSVKNNKAKSKVAKKANEIKHKVKSLKKSPPMESSKSRAVSEPPKNIHIKQKESIAVAPSKKVVQEVEKVPRTKPSNSNQRKAVRKRNQSAITNVAKSPRRSKRVKESSREKVIVVKSKPPSKVITPKETPAVAPTSMYEDDASDAHSSVKFNSDNVEEKTEEKTDSDDSLVGTSVAIPSNDDRTDELIGLEDSEEETNQRVFSFALPFGLSRRKKTKKKTRGNKKTMSKKKSKDILSQFDFDDTY